jgi:hypothetical protein
VITGRICVPIDPLKCDEFDPLNVPTLSSLISEINNYARKEPKSKADMDLDSDDMATSGTLLFSFPFFRWM